MAAKKKTTTSSFKLTRPVTDSELLHALKNSMSPIFEHFEQEIAKTGGKVLHIEVTARPGGVKMNYGFSDLKETIPCALCDRGDGQLGHAEDCPND